MQPGAIRFKFPYKQKLHSAKDFKTVLKNGRRLDSDVLKVVVFKNDAGCPRLGLITSRKAGSAVKRNRTKRKLREIFRLNKHNIAAGTDIIFILKPETVRLKFDDLQNAVILLLQKAHLYFAGNNNEKSSPGTN